MAESSPALRWGFLSTANIGKTNRKAVQRAGSSVVAVASRSLASAKAFAESENIPRALGSYDELLEDPEVDAVYIPLPTGLHCDWAVKCAAAGKHVLCEKPLATSVSEAQKLISAVTGQGLMFMDGLMFMHHPRYRQLQQVLADEDTFGRVISVHTGFSFPGMQDPEFVKSNIRLSKELEPMGAVGDLAWYNVRFSLFAFGFELPLAVTAVAHREYKGVPTDVTATLYFSGGRHATFHASFHGPRRQLADVVGEKKCAFLRDFVRPEKEDSPFELSTAGLLDRETVPVAEPVSQEAIMFQNFARLATGQQQEEVKVAEDPDFAFDQRDYWPKVSILTQAVMDACMRSIDAKGVRSQVWPGLCTSEAQLAAAERPVRLSQFELQQLLELDFASLDKDFRLADE